MGTSSELKRPLSPRVKWRPTRDNAVKTETRLRRARPFYAKEHEHKCIRQVSWLLVFYPLSHLPISSPETVALALRDDKEQPVTVARLRRTSTDFPIMPTFPSSAT